MINSLPDRIIALAASPNVSLQSSETDQWLVEALATQMSVLGEMQKSIEIPEQSSPSLSSAPSRWQAVKLDASKPQKRKVIIKRRK